MKTIVVCGPDYLLCYLELLTWNDMTVFCKFNVFKIDLEYVYVLCSSATNWLIVHVEVISGAETLKHNLQD